MNEKNIKLYNVIFPIWMLWLFPQTWLVVLPANFLVDLTVVALTMKCLKVNGIKSNVKSTIFKVWGFGFLSDFIGTAAMFLLTMIEFDENTALGRIWDGSSVTYGISFNPLDNVGAFLCVTLCVIITACFIYLFNYKVSFRKLEIETDQKKRLALSLAIFTAPYLFYIPTNWFVK